MKQLRNIAAIIVVIGYFGFEAYNLHRLGYRMEPLYIFDQFASAHVAIQHCGQADSSERRRFADNFAYVTARAEEDLTERYTDELSTQPQELADNSAPKVPEQHAEGSITDRLALRQAEVEALLESQGCDGPDLRRLVKFHEIRARLNLG